MFTSNAIFAMKFVYMKIILSVLTVTFCYSLQAQAILTINGKDIALEEFQNMYEKSAEDADYSESSLQEYLQLFVNYQLKMAEAEQKGIPDKNQVKQEIDLYENRLIESELNKELLLELQKEAYSRLQEEICASHILIDVKSNPEPIDTVLALKKAKKLRDRIINGEDFGYIAEKNSADMSTKYNNGSLGCFTTLQLNSYELENAIYGLHQGQVSQPVRTKLGYHIIKINERRSTNGLVKAKQLFSRANKTQTPEENMAAKQAIEKAYWQLQNGDDFNTTADSLFLNKEEIEVSRDDIDWFSVGSYEDEFENAIFSLQEPGDYSKPVKTSVGWHIFMLEERKDLPDFNDLEEALSDKIKQDERYYQSKLNFGEKLKAKYKFKQDSANYELFVDEVAPGIGIQGWQIPRIYDVNLPLFSIEEQEYPAVQFINYVKEQHRNNQYHGFEYYYNDFESDQLLNYHKQKLIEKDDELKSLLNEYKNGIVMFQLMEEQLWSQNEPTEQQLRDYYAENSNRYNQPDQVKVKVYTVDADDGRTQRKLRKILRKGQSEYYIKKLNRKEEKVLFSEKFFNKKEAVINKTNLFNIGEYAEVETKGAVQFYVSEEMIKGESKSFEEVKQQVANDFEKSKEQKWVDGLKQKHSVIVHESVLDKLIRS